MDGSKEQIDQVLREENAQQQAQQQPSTSDQNNDLTKDSGNNSNKNSNKNVNKDTNETTNVTLDITDSGSNNNISDNTSNNNKNDNNNGNNNDNIQNTENNKSTNNNNDNNDKNNNNNDTNTNNNDNSLASGTTTTTTTTTEDATTTKMAGSTSLLSCGAIRLTVSYDEHVNRAEVKVHDVKDLPSKERGGAIQVQVRTLLLPMRKYRQKTKVVVASEAKATFEEFLSFKVNKDDFHNTSLRIRLYGHERLKRDRLIGEVILHFRNINTTGEEFWSSLEPRSNLSHGDSLSSMSSLNSGSDSSTLSLNFGGTLELMLGLSYNWQTGRLAVEVIKGSNFKSVTAKRPPDTYVKIGVVTPDNNEISKSKTSLRRAQPNPLYKETFMFQIPQQQLPEASLLVSVFVQKSLKRNVMIGWFTMGHTNSSEDESSHWTAMLGGRENQVCRWHTLLEP